MPAGHLHELMGPWGKDSAPPHQECSGHSWPALGPSRDSFPGCKTVGKTSVGFSACPTMLEDRVTLDRTGLPRRYKQRQGMGQASLCSLSDRLGPSATCSCIFPASLNFECLLAGLISLPMTSVHAQGLPEAALPLWATTHWTLQFVGAEGAWACAVSPPPWPLRLLTRHS